MVEFKYKIGTRYQVMNGTAKMTGGGLTKSNLKYNKRGKIVSRKVSKLAKKNNRLVKAGFITRKGQFGVIKKGGGTNFNYNIAFSRNNAKGNFYRLNKKGKMKTRRINKKTPYPAPFSQSNERIYKEVISNSYLRAFNTKKKEKNE